MTPLLHSPASTGVSLCALGTAAVSTLLVLAGCADPSELSESNIAKGVELALAERDPWCFLGLLDDPVPRPLEAKYPTKEDGLPLYFIGQTEAELLDRQVSQNPNRNRSSSGRITLRDHVEGGVLTYTTVSESYDEPGGPQKILIAVATPTPKVKGWTQKRDVLALCYARSKVAAIDSFTQPVDTPQGKVVHVEYRSEIDEVASFVQGDNEAALRASAPKDGDRGRVTLVATNEGWVPLKRGR